MSMFRRIGLLAAGLLVAATSAAVAQEPKRGGIMRIYQRDNPASASIHEEATFSTNVPFMAVFNNLVMFKQDVAQNTTESIVPELATAWAWGAGNTSLAFTLRAGVKWHDGKPFTARDVKCTFDRLQGKSDDPFRKNPRESWYANVKDVVVEGESKVTFMLGRPQPSLLHMLASGYTPVYPCHVSSRDMRVKPIGTGPFRFVEFKQNEIIKLTRNPDYWRPGRPYLDGIELPIVTNRSTAILGFVAGRFDMTFPTEVTPPLLKDVMSQAPKSVCKLVPMNVSTNLIVNRDSPPFDNPDIRRAMALSLDRKAFIDILSDGKADPGGTMLPAPEGVWGMPADMLRSMIGYDPDTEKSRNEARAIMTKLGYGPQKLLKVKISTRNIPAYRDPAVILIDHLKQIFIEGELDIVETSVWFAKVARKDYAVGLNLTGNAIDDPDQSLFENYACGSERNYTQYCNKDLEVAFQAQSQETDVEKRKRMVWEIDRQLQNDVARPIMFHGRTATCWHPDLRGYTAMINSSYNGYRFEDVWLDR